MPSSAGDTDQSIGWKDPLEKEMAIHSSTLAWEIPWTEESGGLQFTGLQRVGHDLATKQQHIKQIRSELLWCECVDQDR